MRELKLIAPISAGICGVESNVLQGFDVRDPQSASASTL